MIIVIQSFDWNWMTSKLASDQIRRYVRSSSIMHSDSWEIEYSQNGDDREKVSDSATATCSPRFLRKCRPQLIKMTPFLITTIHVPP